MLTDAQDAAQRIRAIVRDLRLFSRADDTASEAVDVHAVLTSSLRMAENEIRHRARLRRELAAVPHVRANESRLGQVFLNLIVNAVQAMPDGRTSQNELRAATWVAADGRVVIEIADTGIGIEPHVKKRLFTPFFTTKSGEGTGLGLSICHRIVSQLGGEITVDSTPGRGSSFKVHLPAIVESPAATPPPVESRPSGQRSRLLVVDDDHAVAAAIGRMLARDHDVTVVHRAIDALALIQRGERFDVILSDLMMPEMTGADLHAALLALAPEQAAAMVFVTGGAFTPSARSFLASVPNPVLEKPFDLKALRQILDDRSY
jgi:CheY-like chemotaxis protein/two-component sensor histidine kinase